MYQIQIGKWLNARDGFVCEEGTGRYYHLVRYCEKYRIPWRVVYDPLYLGC